jgi:adenine-specific DNA methylase
VASHLRAFERRLEYLNNQIQDEPKRADFYAEEVRALLWLRDLANEVCSCAPVEEGALQKPCWHCRTHGVLEARRQLDVKKAELAKVRRVIEEERQGSELALKILGVIGGRVEVNHVG